MEIIDRFKPKFWYHSDVNISLPYKHHYNFRKLWKVILLLMLSASLLPLLIIAAFNYKVNKEAMESELLLRTTGLVSNTRRSISYFLDERKAALKFILLNNNYETLVSSGFLEKLLEDLKNGFGGFGDIGIINENGIQVAYEGPYQLIGKDYSNINWFNETVAKGVYISEVFKGFRHIPHLVIAVKHQVTADKFYIIRATIETNPFNELLSNLEIEGYGDAFLINKEGILQTPYRHCRDVLEKVDIDITEFLEDSNINTVEISKNALVIGYAYIEDSPFILVIIKYKDLLIKQWRQTRYMLIVFLIVSVVIIILVILGGITYLVNQLYFLDKRRLLTMHKVEYANKMASLGILSAGIAHEINNPLAIINEKVGLIQDIFTLNKTYNYDSRFMASINSIISSVERCAEITRRLLNFARHSEGELAPICLKEVLEDVLGFMGKEADYRGIDVKICVDDDLELFESDKGKLQEIFLNLLMNAFYSVENEGKINIEAKIDNKDYISVSVSDNGCGIQESDLERIFEPFFSNRIDGSSGTGLGLSITYGLVKEMGGEIKVRSEVGKGTTFIIVIPYKRVKKI